MDYILLMRWPWHELHHKPHLKAANPKLELEENKGKFLNALNKSYLKTYKALDKAYLKTYDEKTYGEDEEIAVFSLNNVICGVLLNFYYPLITLARDSENQCIRFDCFLRELSSAIFDGKEQEELRCYYYLNMELGVFAFPIIIF